MKTIHGIEIKDGYLLVVKTGEETHNMTVVSCRRRPFDSEELGCATPKKYWWPLREFSEGGLFADSEVVAIYGRTSPKFLLDNDTYERELLWKEKQPIEEEVINMTIDEIQKKLGHKIRIVE